MAPLQTKWFEIGNKEIPMRLYYINACMMHTKQKKYYISFSFYNIIFSVITFVSDSVVLFSPKRVLITFWWHFHSYSNLNCWFKKKMNFVLNEFHVVFFFSKNFKLVLVVTWCFSWNIACMQVFVISTFKWYMIMHFRLDTIDWYPPFPWYQKAWISKNRNGQKQKLERKALQKSFQKSLEKIDKLQKLKMPTWLKSRLMKRKKSA